VLDPHFLHFFQVIYKPLIMSSFLTKGVEKMENRQIVSIRNLKRSFKFGESEIFALNGVDLNVIKGDFIVVLGPSGAGKTTLLNMIGGIDKPTEGEV